MVQVRTFYTAPTLIRALEAKVRGWGASARTLHLLRTLGQQLHCTA